LKHQLKMQFDLLENLKKETQPGGPKYDNNFKIYKLANNYMKDVVSMRQWCFNLLFSTTLSLQNDNYFFRNVQQNISLSQKEYSFVYAQMVQLSSFKKFQNKTRIMTALTNINYKGVDVEMQPKQNQVQVQQTSIKLWNIAFFSELFSLLK